MDNTSPTNYTIKWILLESKNPLKQENPLQGQHY